MALHAGPGAAAECGELVVVESCEFLEALADAQGLGVDIDDAMVLSELDAAGLDVDRSGIDSVPVNRLPIDATLFDALPMAPADGRPGLFLEGTPLGSLDVGELTASAQTALFGGSRDGTLADNAGALRPSATLADLASGALSPVAAKRLLARTVVDLYHGEGAGERAEAEFDRVFKEGSVPSEVPEREVAAAELPTAWFRLLPLLGLASSNKDARRKIEQGAVRLDQEKVADPEEEVGASAVDGHLVQVGKRAWAKVKVV